MNLSGKWIRWKPAAVLFLILLINSGCGIKTPPLPGNQILPDKVSSPTYEFNQEGELVVTFRPSTKNLLGRPLNDLGGFYIDRSDNLVEPDFCPGCPVTYSKRIEIQAVTPPDRIKVADVPYSFQDVLKPGYAYYYRIYAHDSKGRYSPERFETLIVNYDSPAAPPDRIEIKTEDNLVFLNWPPSAGLVDGRPLAGLIGYDIYRRENSGDWKKINPGDSANRTSYRDTQVKNQADYEYMIRTVREWRSTIIAGPPSRVYTASPVDLTPPPPPVNLYGVSYAGGVKLTWPAVEAPDLAGYRVYRRTVGKTQVERLGPELITDNLFLDSGAVVGQEYFYRITAVDSSPSANESEPTREIRIRHYRKIEEELKRP